MMNLGEKEMSDFQTTHHNNTSISTLETTTTRDFIHTYIHTYTQKRKKEKRSDRKNITIYNLDQYEAFEEFARRNNSNCSSIINNLYEKFLSTIDSPQKALDSFQFEAKTPEFDASPETIRAFMQTLDYEDFKKFDQKLQTILALANQRWRELR